jgi:hypothetical protein
MTVFWAVASYSLVDVYRHFIGTLLPLSRSYKVHLRGDILKWHTININPLNILTSTFERVTACFL